MSGLLRFPSMRKMHRLKVLFLLAFLSVGMSVFAQKKKEERDTSTIQRTSTAPDEIVINKLRYRTIINWFTIGPAINVNKFGSLDGNLGLDYHITTKKGRFYEFGVMRAKQLAGFFPETYGRLFNELHAAVGYKSESKKKLYGAFIGPSFSMVEYIDPSTYEAFSYNMPGIYLNVEYIIKPIYDVGIGVNGFADVNSHYAFGGFRLVFFFSNAYKGR